MSAWKTASLGEIFDIARGGSPRPIQDYLTDDPDGVNWISISDASASDKFITETKKRIRPEGVSRSRMVKAGDFLLTNSMSFGRPYIMGTSGCIHDGWLVLSSKRDEVDQDYFFHLLGSDFIYAKFTKLAAGATVKNLNIDLVSGVEVSFPPQEEQRRIAAILDQAETLRCQRRAALAQLDSLTQSIFLDMFGDPVTNPKGIRKAALVDVAEISTGSTPGRGADGYYDGSIPWVKTTEVSGGVIRDTEEKLTDAGLRAIRGKLHPVDSILVAMYGQGQTRGRCALLGIEASCNQACGVIKPNQSFLPSFMFVQLSLAYVRLRALGRGGNQENLNLQLLGSFDVLLPPLPLQQTFATRIQAIESLKTTHRTALAELDALFASLQQRAFAGEL